MREVRYNAMMMKKQKKTSGVNRRQQRSESDWKCKLTPEALSQVRVNYAYTVDKLNGKESIMGAVGIPCWGV